MTSVSSVGNGGFAQQVRNRQPGGDGGGFAAALQSVGKASGLDQTTIDALQKQIQDAVRGTGDGKGKPGEKKAAVDAAIENALKGSGIDPTQFKAALEAQVHKAHGHRKHGPKNDHDADDAGAIPPPSVQAAPDLTGSGRSVDISV